MTKTILKNLNIDALNVMQEEAISSFATHNNSVLISPTGSGKTLAFLLGILAELHADVNHIQALIITPSRELALQIESVFRLMNTGYKVNSCFGGHKMSIEVNNFVEPPAVLVGTPGRILDHISKENFETDFIRLLVLDEFDKSLEFGFRSEMEAIIRNLTGLQKRILTSATNTVEIPDFTGIVAHNKLDFSANRQTLAGMKAYTVSSDSKDKLSTLFYLLCQISNEATLVFCNHRDAAKRVSDSLNSSGVVNELFHGGLDQVVRERVIAKFRNGSCNVLVCTDLAARGLDIPEVKNVVHYHFPANEDSYTHRNGRTARMNAEGNVFVILNKEETLPSYIHTLPEIVDLTDSRELPSKPYWSTIYIGKGKKDKLNKVDIVGFLMQKGNLRSEEIGLIEVKDNFAYVAVKRTVIGGLLRRIRNEKIKNKKAVIEECL